MSALDRWRSFDYVNGSANSANSGGNPQETAVFPFADRLRTVANRTGSEQNSQPFADGLRIQDPQKSAENWPYSQVSQNSQAVHSEADDAAVYEDRAAIVEYEAGVPREWAEGFAALDCRAAPPNISAARWNQIINDGGIFIDRWAREAAALGWQTLDVFGVSANAPEARLDCAGLIWLLGGHQIVAITDASATIRVNHSLQTYRRRPVPIGTIAVWDLEA